MLISGTGLLSMIREERRTVAMERIKKKKGNSAEAELSYLSQALCANLHGAHAFDTRRRFASCASSVSISRSVKAVRGLAYVLCVMK